MSKHILAVGKVNDNRDIVIVPTSYDAFSDDDWDKIIIDQIDSLPVDPPDFISPDFLGALDADEGLPCEPSEYYAKLGDIEQYVIGYKDAVGAWQGVTALAVGQRARWLYKPFCGPMRGKDVVIEEVGAELVTIRISGPDGDYYRKVEPKRLFVIPTESEVAII